ncbi:MAG: hypothetical protein IJ939_01595 [Clostridia bacterium]|nr:hypothetical protein [Clostridia bacterium]
MNGNKFKKINFSSPAFRMIASGFVLFLCALAFTPSSGVFRTLPFFLVGGAVSYALSVSTSVIAAFSGIMTLCTYLASGRGVGESVFYAAVSCLVAIAGVYIFRFVKSAGIAQKKNVRNKCITAAIVSFAVSLVLCLVLCGNVFSFLSNDAKNTAYIEENYGKTVKKRYTSYEAFAGEYRTYVSFKDGESVYGNDDDCYISTQPEKINDDVRNYHEEKMLYVANARLANVISGATWGYNITASDIAFENREILSADSDIDDYMGRVKYVVSFESIFHESERDKFVSVCEDTVSAIASSGIEFEKILLCGGDASRVLFILEVTENTKREDVQKLVSAFDEKLVKDVGVTEMTILDYWNNK